MRPNTIYKCSEDQTFYSSDSYYSKVQNFLKNVCVYIYIYAYTHKNETRLLCRDQQEHRSPQKGAKPGLQGWDLGFPRSRTREAVSPAGAARRGMPRRITSPPRTQRRSQLDII